MESLPEETRELICQYLAAADLSSCCAVSHSWREMFGGDRLWRVHCDKTLTEHLDVSNCLVEPSFTSPETQDSTLNAIGEWRLNCMKENRLRNNWRLGNFKMEDIPFEKEFYQFIFLNNYYILMFGNGEIYVWEVKTKTKLQSTIPLHENDVYLKVFGVSGTTTFVIVEGLVVRVYNLCCTTYTMQLLHVFSLEMSEKCSETTEEAAEELFIRQGDYEPRDEPACCTIVGNLLVKIPTTLTPLKMHIWNVETGQKLKEESIPITIVRDRPLPVCEKRMNIVVEGWEENEEKCIGHWYVYSLTKLTFFPFKIVLEMCWSQSNDNPDYESIIFEKYIAMRVKGTLYIYNYLTS